MTDLERRVRDALDKLAQDHAPQPQPPQQERRRTTIIDAPRRPVARPAPPPAPKVWGSATRTPSARDLEGRFADAPDATHRSATVRVFVFEVEMINGEARALVIRQDNRQRFTIDAAALANVSDNA